MVVKADTEYLLIQISSSFVDKIHEDWSQRLWSDGHVRTGIRLLSPRTIIG